MKIEDIQRVTVAWMPEFVNDPELEFILKRDCTIARREDMRWRTKGDLFYALSENEVDFLVHDRRDHNGFGFRQFKLHMADDWNPVDAGWHDCHTHNPNWGGGGWQKQVDCVLDPETRILTLTGPWSGGASAVSQEIGPIVSVSTLTGPNRVTVSNPDWYHKERRRGRRVGFGTPYATYYTLEFVEQVLRVHAPHLYMHKGPYGWYPIRKGEVPKNLARELAREQFTGRNRRVASRQLSDAQSMVVEW